MGKISDLLIKCGVRPIVAKTVDAVSDGKCHSLRDIERKADLRQAEASLAVKDLVHNSYLIVEYSSPSCGDEKDQSEARRGRKEKIVMMPRVAFYKYIKDLRSKITKEYEAKVRCLDVINKEGQP